MGKSSSADSSTTDAERSKAVEEAMEELSKQNYGYESMLGNGTYGDVLKVYNSETHTYKAAKVIVRDNVEEQEIVLWTSLKHENILPLEKTILLKSKSVVFISPLLFRSFDDVISDKRFSSLPQGYACVKKWLVDTLKGLDYMHRQYICHLDLKLDNVLISTDGIAKVCDFSFVNMSTEPIYRGRVGLPSIYRPPEIFRKKFREKLDGSKIDLWAYGVLVFEVLTQQQLNYRLEQCNLWSRDVKPLLLLMLEDPIFEILVKDSYPLYNFTENDVAGVLEFIGEFLIVNPSKRLTTAESLQHEFVKNVQSVEVNLQDIFAEESQDVYDDEYEGEEDDEDDDDDDEEEYDDDDDDDDGDLSDNLSSLQKPPGSEILIEDENSSDSSWMSTSSETIVSSDVNSTESSEYAYSNNNQYEASNIKNELSKNRSQFDEPIKSPKKHKLKMGIQNYRKLYRYKPIAFSGSFHSQYADGISTNDICA